MPNFFSYVYTKITPIEITPTEIIPQCEMLYTPWFEREDGAVETFWSFQEKVEYSLPYKWKVSVCVYNTLYKGFFVLFDEMRREKTV